MNLVQNYNKNHFWLSFYQKQPNFRISVVQLPLQNILKYAFSGSICPKNSPPTQILVGNPNQTYLPHSLLSSNRSWPNLYLTFYPCHGILRTPIYHTRCLLYLGYNVHPPLLSIKISYCHYFPPQFESSAGSHLATISQSEASP